MQETVLSQDSTVQRETFADFMVLWLIVKVFSAKLGTWHPLACMAQASKMFAAGVHMPHC